MLSPVCGKPVDERRRERETDGQMETERTRCGVDCLIINPEWLEFSPVIEPEVYPESRAGGREAGDAGKRC